MTFPRFFTNTAAALLLALSTALFLINLTGAPDLVLPRDPISGLSLRYLFWIIGGLAVLVAWFCLFSERPARTIPWVAWLATNFLIYRIALYFEGCHSLTGFLASVTYAFGLPAKAASVLVDMAFAYLLIGSSAALLYHWLRSSQTPLLHRSTTPSLHASTTPPLQPSNTPFLKTSCFFCKGHIEFPPHAIGEKIHCPHCKMDITLKEPT
jgi:hypothetical protein